MSTQIIERMSIGFDTDGVQALNHIKSTTHLKTNGDIGRAGLNVLHDLVIAEGRGYRIVLENDAGERWLYSPHRPATATPLGERAADNVIRLPLERTIKEKAGKSVRAKAPVGA